jgi:hypothetical protein
MTEAVQHVQPPPDEPAPSYLEVIGPAYRRNALTELAQISELSAACYVLLQSDALNLTAFTTLVGALDASYHRWTSALVGMDGALSCTGSA